MDRFGGRNGAEQLALAGGAGGELNRQPLELLTQLTSVIVVTAGAAGSIQGWSTNSMIGRINNALAVT